MKRLLIFLLVLVSLGLCAVSVEQWRREARLRAAIEDLIKKLQAENLAKVEALRKVREYEREIERINALRAEVEAKLVEITREFNDLTTDNVARGITIAIYMLELNHSQLGHEAARIALGQGTNAIQDRNAQVAGQNDTIQKQNVMLRELAQERDSAISKLNARTRELNEVVEKYNKLAKER
ncbi:MAG: hypothetical protein ACO1TE_21740 [Prosthecobacter sp.]